MDNCEKCIMDFKNNNLICKECITNYALKYNDNVICIEKSVFDGDNTFFTNDSGKSYYSCSLFNNVQKCLQCSNKETCSVCQEGYDLVNDNTLCILQEDVKNN